MGIARCIERGVDHYGQIIELRIRKGLEAGRVGKCEKAKCFEARKEYSPKVVHSPCHNEFLSMGNGFVKVSKITNIHARQFAIVLT